MGFSLAYLNTLHSLVFLIGAAVTALSIVLIVEGNVYFPDMYGSGQWFAWVPFGVGVLLMFLAILGCCCTKEGNVIFLSIYGTFQFLCGGVIIVVGAFLVTATQKWLYNIADTPTASQGLEAGVGGLQHHFSDFMIGLAAGCCQSRGTQFNIQQCEDASVGYCFIEPEPFGAGFKAGEGASESYCAIRELVNACDAADIDGFFDANYDILYTNVRPFGIALLAFGCVLFLASFFSCYVGCKKPKKQNYDGFYKNAGQTAYGGGAYNGVNLA